MKKGVKMEQCFIVHVQQPKPAGRKMGMPRRNNGISKKKKKLAERENGTN